MPLTVGDTRADMMTIAHHGTDDERAALRIAMHDVSVVLDAREQDPGAERLIVPAVNRDATTTTDGRPVDVVREEQRHETGMHTSYIVLSPEERAKGFVRPVRTSYRHVTPKIANPLRDLTTDEHARHEGRGYVKFEVYPAGGPTTGRYWTQSELDRIARGCNAVTGMGLTLAETYARDPGFYNATYCCRCGSHYPVGPEGEFVWCDVGPEGEFVWCDEPSSKVGT